MIRYFIFVFDALLSVLICSRLSWFFSNFSLIEAVLYSEKSPERCRVCGSILPRNSVPYHVTPTLLPAAAAPFARNVIACHITSPRQIPTRWFPGELGGLQSSGKESHVTWIFLQEISNCLIFPEILQLTGQKYLRWSLLTCSLTRTLEAHFVTVG